MRGSVLLAPPVRTELVRPGVLRCDTWPGFIRRDARWSNPAEFRDFGNRLATAEGIKRQLRAHYAALARPRTFEQMLSEAIEFWTEYDEIGQRYVPEDPCYSKATTGTALSTTNDFWELASASAGQLRILESFIGGEATASAVNRVQLHRVSSQGTGTAPTSFTPPLFNTRSPAAAGTYYGALSAVVTWGTAQSTLGANPLVVHAYNAFGGTDRWVAQPGEELYSVNAEYLALRSFSGTSTVSAYVVVEEL